MDGAETDIVISFLSDIIIYHMQQVICIKNYLSEAGTEDHETYKCVIEITSCYHRYLTRITIGIGNAYAKMLAKVPVP